MWGQGADWSSARQTAQTFLRGHLNGCLPIPVLKQCVNSTQQNGFSKDSACMYDLIHEAACDWGSLVSGLEFLWALLIDFGVKGDL